MSRCFQCTAQFGFFKKEHDCKNCGKSFCKSCLTGKAPIPTYGSKEVRVCMECYKRLTRGVTENEKPPPYQEVIYPPYKSKEKVSSQQLQTSQPAPDPDAEIRAQLNNLKKKDSEGNDGAEPSSSNDQDIGERFKELTGRLPQSMQKSDILTPKPKLTEAEEIDLLMKGAIEETQLHSKLENERSGMTVDDLEKRLLALQGIDPDKEKRERNEAADSSEDETEAAEQVLRKALQEKAIDDKVKASGHGYLLDRDREETIDSGITLPGVPKQTPGTQEMPSLFQGTESDEEELPWCCICNADAKLRCHGCDDDLYCRSCFIEGHRGEDMEEHKTSPFREKGN